MPATTQDQREQFQYDHERALAQRENQQAQARRSIPRGVLPHTDADERHYNLAMASLLADRGFLNLAESHLVLAKDCPRGCSCDGCEAQREDARERREAKDRRVRPRAAAAVSP